MMRLCCMRPVVSTTMSRISGSDSSSGNRRRNSTSSGHSSSSSSSNGPRIQQDGMPDCRHLQVGR